MVRRLRWKTADEFDACLETWKLFFRAENARSRWQHRVFRVFTTIVNTVLSCTEPATSHGLGWCRTGVFVATAICSLASTVSSCGIQAKTSSWHRVLHSCSQYHDPSRGDGRSYRRRSRCVLSWRGTPSPFESSQAGLSENMLVASDGPNVLDCCECDVQPQLSQVNVTPARATKKRAPAGLSNLPQRPKTSEFLLLPPLLLNTQPPITVDFFCSRPTSLASTQSLRLRSLITGRQPTNSWLPALSSPGLASTSSLPAPTLRHSTWSLARLQSPTSVPTASQPSVRNKLF